MYRATVQSAVPPAWAFLSTPARNGLASVGIQLVEVICASVVNATPPAGITTTVPTGAVDAVAAVVARVALVRVEVDALARLAEGLGVGVEERVRVGVGLVGEGSGEAATWLDEPHALTATRQNTDRKRIFTPLIVSPPRGARCADPGPWPREP